MPVTPSTPRIHYTLLGDSGPPVLFVMGFGMGGNAWQPQTEDLRADHQCLVFDNCGVGESETRRRPWSIPDMAEDGLRVLEAIGWERVHLVGVSMGGMIARALVSAQPHRFASLTLIASHAGGLRHMVPTRVGLTNFARAQTAPPAERMLALERLLFPTEWVQSIDRDALRDRLLTRTKRAPRATILTQLQAMIRYGRRPETGAFRVPTLVLKPSDDVLVPPHNSDLLTQRIAGSRLVTIAGAGHGATFSHATQLNAALREHFDAHPVT